MTKIIMDEDCGNSPKNLFIQKLTIAFAKGNFKFITDSVTEDIRWDIVGRRLIQGKAEFAEALKQMKDDEISELVIEHISTHGKAGAVNGTRKSKSGKVFAFCDVYEFNKATGTSIKGITSYVIELK